MAKGKHAAALFEVIHSGKRPEHAAGALRTPKWWFKGRAVQPYAAPSAEAEEAASYLPPEPEPQLTAPRPQVSRNRTRIQSEGHPHELTMRMRFSTLVVGGFVMLVLVGIAYVIGRHVAGGPESATASSINPNDDLKPVRGALDVPRRTARTPSNTATANSGPTIRHGDSTKPHEITPPPAVGDVAPPEPVVEATGQREFGLNYIVVMTYPPDRKQIAQQASDYLTKRGIPCSVEEAPPIFHRGWWAVMTRRGFVKTTSDPAYNACMERIEDLAPEFARTTRSDRFSPTSFKLK